ncbi:ATP-dependent RNA helicase DHX58 [Danio rerio]|uniref:RNA helicase n=1 Tax=Danio rerio TaxID=7955 RepID=F1QUY3_DANRE|nr:probable ATP-dependent RNA helicase DHX58 [Danio rerio]XP_009297544.1 probable ATP-dependent RNA helicase DHX58 isoform X1 [Danio rerio]AEN04477.1 probable ATP-dependent helicase LGP2 [Danio rerio]|eukprot:NP_001244086.1 probable ATP-dependent RNA helicase DHX58 [Danio rerio]
MELRLRPYQEEVVQAALRGENSIIWLPTGGGKTRAAVYVAEKHLETKANAKVAVLVNKVHLVDQHYMKEFGHYLRHKYRIKAISGDSSEKDFFGRLVRVSDLVICTAQILENALNNMDEDKHVEITDFTLLVIDECHHTNKESVYNKIMWRYVEKKVRKEGRLPQILGLTASPGTGGNKSLDKAVEHVLQICANLDSKIVSTKNYTPMLQNFVPKPKKEYDIVERRDKDPFGDHLKSMMLMIHEFMPPTVSRGLRELGTQEYEADVVELEKAGVKVNNRLIAQCALHLRKYNDALLINDTIRMVDAFRVLEEFYNSRSSKLLDGTDIFLQGLFDENSLELKHLASDARYENPKLAQLQSRLLEEFQDTNSRGIIFSKTRRGTHCLNDWVKTNRELQRVNITAGILTGAGNGANNMTQTEQKSVISHFRQGYLNLLISTSVAEEGLDIPECNLVVRYGLLTNEIAQQQASGRARASNSVYSVVADVGGREVRKELVNEYLEDLTARAIDEVQRMSPVDFRHKVFELQKTAVVIRMEAERKRDAKKQRYSPGQVQLQCRSCFASVCSGGDIRKIENSHHVNVNTEFKNHYKVGDQVNMERTFEDWEPGRIISCRKCKKDWGFEIKFKKVAILPCLKIKSFSFNTPKETKPYKKWKDVEFQVTEFDFIEYMSCRFPDLDLSD